MEYQIRLTPEALADLEAIQDYIRADNAAAAERFGASLLRHVEMLWDFPRLGVPLRRRRSYRKLLHSPIRIYYRIHETAKMIEVLHFWHGARRGPKL